ncbi:MAG: hypothetical protein K8T20_17130, partial [Planctomycetes bacterium]|nr:hypothetical protein [Planctomycetota bacterium]
DDWVPLKASVALVDLGEPAGIEHLLIAAKDAEGHMARVTALKSLKRSLPGAGADPGDDEGLEALSSWWKAHGSTSTFDKETKAWKETK